MNRIYLEQYVDKHCWNLYDSYGEICVKCNCCGQFDKDSMYASRLKVIRRWLKELEENKTDPHFQTELQQKNIRIDICRCKRLIRYYERKEAKHE